MVKFVKLKFTHDNEDVFVSPESVGAVCWDSRYSATFVHLLCCDGRFSVIGTPEEVVARLADKPDPRDARIAKLEAALRAILEADARGQGVLYEEAMNHARTTLAVKPE